MKRKVIALTGGIGSGKSEVARILREMGYSTVDCDVLAKQVADDPNVIAGVEQLLGSEFVQDGKLNRKAIRDKVFADGNLLLMYQALFFDGVKRLLQEYLLITDSETVFVEIPILDAFEFNWDEAWCVESDETTRISRVTVRDGISEESVKRTLERQKQYSNCTRVIYNNGTLDELKATVMKILVESNLT